MLLDEMVEVIVIEAKGLSLLGPCIGLKGEAIGEPLFREAAIPPGVAEVIGERLLIFFRSPRQTRIAVWPSGRSLAHPIVRHSAVALP